MSSHAGQDNNTSCNMLLTCMERDVRSREAVGEVEVPESGEGGGGREFGEE